MPGGHEQILSGTKQVHRKRRRFLERGHRLGTNLEFSWEGDQRVTGHRRGCPHYPSGGQVPSFCRPPTASYRVSRVRHPGEISLPGGHPNSGLPASGSAPWLGCRPPSWWIGTASLGGHLPDLTSCCGQHECPSAQRTCLRGPPPGVVHAHQGLMFTAATRAKRPGTTLGGTRGCAQ